MSDSTLAERPTSVKDYLALPSYRDRFHEVMGKRANQFMAAIVASSQLPGLKDAEPRSVIAAAMVAATLDLPVNPTLGQAHIVAYNDGQNGKVAQFQIGYKGLIQLALRSGQYKRLNAGPVSAGAFKGFDMVGEPVLDFMLNDPTKEAAGYYCAFETLNGFIKVVYFSYEQAEAHAKRFSRAYAKGYATPWKSDFDAMATKTVIKAALGKWGLLSVEMQKAVVHDQGAQADVDADVQYVDGDDKPADATAEEAPKRPPAPRKAKGAASVIDVVQEPASVTVATPVAEPTPVAEAAPAVTEPAAPVEPTPAAQPKSTVTAQPGQPRAFIKDAEEIECEVVVNAAEGVIRSSDQAPMVKATVSGGYTGIIYDLKNNELSGDEVMPKAPWAKDARLKVRILGEKSQKSGNVIAYVQAAAAVQEES